MTPPIGDDVPDPDRQLTIVGATPAGLSLAIEAKEAGLSRTVVIATGENVVIPETIGRHALDIVQVPDGVEVEASDSGVLVKAPGLSMTSQVLVDAQIRSFDARARGIPVAAGVAERVHTSLDGWNAREADVLVVGDGERAAVTAQTLIDDAANVILVLPEDHANRLSLLSRRALFDLEADRRITIFWTSSLAAIEDLLGFPMAAFSDRRTPDLQFDHVVLAFGDRTPTSGAPPGVFVLVDADEAAAPLIPLATAWEHVRARFWPDMPVLAQRQPFLDPAAARRVGELREQSYNATITYFDTRHSDLWVLRIRPDEGGASLVPGQYATLGLGYWEPRIDEVAESLPQGMKERLVRRSYSISSPIFDERGYLIDPTRGDEIELYVVLVRASENRVPELTPRLALKGPGDRIYLGPKIAGRYTSSVVDDPTDKVVFLATGTGEAPHNAMIVELLRRGHYGPIISVVSVRQSTDLGYLAEHRRLESRYGNYTYLPLTTRDPDTIDKKLHIQDLIERGMLAERLGGHLDPASTHVFLCGNPAMIGLPTWEGDVPRFPETRGACEILHGLGFALDRRGAVGRVHHEEYW